MLTTVMRSICGTLIFTCSIQMALAEDCPADRLVFKDKKTGSEFAAERVALDFLYECKGKNIKSTVMRNDLSSCRGPYGDTIIEGYLKGQKVFAVYTVIQGSPCCGWDSFSGENIKILKKVKSWASGANVPSIKLGSTWFTIEDNDPWKLNGPLGGGSFVPTYCRR